MKYLTFSLLLLATINGFSQEPAPKIVDFATIKSWMSKAMPHQVIAKYGEPSRELIRPNETVLIYEQGPKEYTFRFNEAKQLQGFALDTKQTVPTDQLPYATVRKARESKTAAELVNRLGQPTQVLIGPSSDVWYYTVGSEDTAHKNVIVTLDSETGTTVKSFAFFADSPAPKVLTGDMVEFLKKGVSKAQDITQKLGEPSKIIMKQDGESWFYTSAYTTLMLVFDKTDTVSDYVYEKKSGE